LHYRVSEKNIKRIVIVRPTIPAGDDDDIGYLPGDLNEKMGPFIAPFVRDSAPLLIETPGYMNPQEYKQFVENFLTSLDIEIVPLMFMRGRTFNNSFVILDEAQNCTKNDFKLFLTRIGKHCKVIIEGDSTQADRDNGYLPELKKDLAYMDHVSIVNLDGKDIVRNPLIAEILKRIS
jgi:phosphate starvation-inducible PhoH-like protein